MTLMQLCLTVKAKCWMLGRKRQIDLSFVRSRFLGRPRVCGASVVRHADCRL